jgi:hypothetical protein
MLGPSSFRGSPTPHPRAPMSPLANSGRLRFTPVTLFFAFLLLSPLNLLAQADVSFFAGLPDPCASTSEWTSTGPVALANLQVFRGPLDFRGPRVVGCLRNDGPVSLEQMMLEFESPPGPGGAGGGWSMAINARLGDLPPGGTVPFNSDELWADLFSGGAFPDFRLTALDVLEKDTFSRPRFPVERGPAIGAGSGVDRPEHPLETECRALAPEGSLGAVHLQAFRIEVVAPGAAPVLVGCVFNGTDEEIGEEGGIPAQLEGIETAALGGEGFVLRTGSLGMPELPPPGESRFFGSSFEIAPDLVEISITLLRYDYELGTADVIGGPVRLRERR